MPIYPYLHRTATIFNLSEGDAQVQKLLKILPSNELRIIRKHKDLIDRVKAIVNTPVKELVDEIESQFGLVVNRFGAGEIWIDNEGLADAVPSWVDSYHFGWYTDTDKLSSFCREFLLQEVRTNIYIRYLEFKSLKLEEKARAKATQVVGVYGNYL